MARMLAGTRWFDKSGRIFGARPVGHRVVLADMPGQSFSGAMKPALIDRSLYCSRTGFSGIVHDGRRARDRIDRYATDTCETLELPLDPARVENREQTADVERESCHGRFFPRFLTELFFHKYVDAVRALHPQQPRLAG